MHLLDLTFIDENKNWINRDDGTPCVNLYKQQLIYTNIQKLLHYQSTPHQECSASSPIYNFLLELARLDENELYALSLEREPRGAAANLIQ